MQQLNTSRKNNEPLILCHKKYFKTRLFAFIIFISYVALVTPLSSMKTNNICRLCNNGERLKENHVKLYSKVTKATNILFESKNFYVAIDNYPICNCHILIISKEHNLSFSTINIALEYELEAIIDTISDIVKTQEYGIFEHGSNMPNSKQEEPENSIYHAHLHFIPHLEMSQKNIINLCSTGEKDEIISLNSNKKLASFCTKKNNVQTFLRYIKSLPTKKPYLFGYYSNTKKTSICISDDIIKDGPPPQVFRRIIARHFQETKPFWNWKKEAEVKKSMRMRNEIIKKTIEMFQDKENIKLSFQTYLKNYQKKI